MEQIQLIYVTVMNKNEAVSIARALVTEKLAACANIIPNITSIYIWEKSLNIDKEVLLLLKTKLSLVESAISRIKSLHSYEIPCIVSYESKSGNIDYLDWVRNSL
jgi:periplasmic divalent cation tolerance protein